MEDILQPGHDQIEKEMADKEQAEKELQEKEMLEQAERIRIAAEIEEAKRE